MKLKKKLAVVGMCLALCFGVIACGKASEAINVISREQGSGTRAAFTEITGILEKKDGKEVDNTSKEAAVQNSTEAVITAVANDKDAIGYISLGSLNDTVKAVKVDGVEATPENITNGTYKIARPFLIVYKEDKLNDASKDFMKFIESDEGQKIVADEGYVPEIKNINYTPANITANLTIAGSTSVTPLMEKLVEGYKKYNPGFNADIQATGSSAGITAVQDGACDLGMSSRELKDSEKDLQKDVIAKDGVAVIVNKDNKVDNLTLENIKDIFTGKVTNWDEV